MPRADQPIEEPSSAVSPAVEAFIARWSPSGGGERSNYQLFLSELCDVLGVTKPEPAVADVARNAYIFDRSIPHQEPDGSTTTNFIDLYKRGCFICETKQGVEAATNRDTDLPSPSPRGGERAGVRAFARRGHGIRGSGTWDIAMEKARNQAEQYARALPAAEGRPPFLLIVDVGYSIELFAEFTCTGGTYVRFPDPRAHRIHLPDLREARHRETLRKIWTEPLSLDPARRSAKVTRDIADHLAKLARSFEKQGHDAQAVADFLMRCIFTMFAEDVRLLPDNSFKRLLESLRTNLRAFPTLVGALWKDMATGAEFSMAIRERVLHFNGGLFESATALPVTAEQLELLLEASRADWRDVEPAIFGTLLERALSPRERHKLGAHHTPRAYVERLVFPTVIDPLRAEWETVKTAAAQLAAEADAAEAKVEDLHARSNAAVKAGDAKAVRALQAEETKLKRALKTAREEVVQPVRAFHRHLCQIRVLDPACGSANFLYVTMEHMKRLEGEVLELLTELGDPQLETEMREFKVRPHQFIGLEINPWAVPIAELVLWIGYLQSHFRTSDKAVPDDPVISKEHSIRKQDAVLAYDRKEMVTWAMARENPDLPGLPDDVREQLRAPEGRVPRPGEAAVGNARTPREGTRPTGSQPITVWDGHTTKPHPVTGKEVPDETARVPIWRYVNPRQAEWPEADYVVGNPPFIGGWKIRATQGDGYVETLWQLYDLPEKCDFVMYWWDKGAELLSAGRIRRFGFITTNSLSQVFQRRVIERRLAQPKPTLHLAYAVPDHPWTDSADGAAVRISMTVAEPGSGAGKLATVVSETETSADTPQIEIEERIGAINSNLTIGVDTSTVLPLAANDGIISPGVQLYGSGFILSADERGRLLEGATSSSARAVIKTYMNAKDMVQSSRGAYVIDFFGYNTEAEARELFPAAYQWVLDRVKPERDQNRREAIRVNWWRFGWERPKLRAALSGCTRYIVTPETAKHRIFTFLDADVLADNMLTAIASGDALLLGVLSSQVHETWALASGGTLEDRPRYTKARCFDPFPFPDPDSATRERIRVLGEQLDAHRKRQQALHPGLTLTGMYNVLEKLRAAEVGRVTPCAPSGESATTGASPRSNGGQRTDPPYQLTPKEKEIHEQGLVSVLQQIHDDLDAAVFHAYGWDDLLNAERGMRNAELEETILERLVALNHQRAEEEKRGVIRWLRPEFQNRGQKSEVSDQNKPENPALPMEIEESLEDEDRPVIPPSAVRISKLAWPKTLAEQVHAVSQALAAAAQPLTAAEVAGRFQRANKERIAEILETLVALGKARPAGKDRYQA